MGWVAIGKANEVADGSVRRYEAGGRPIAVARSEDRWYAFDDTCTHRQCSLSEGEVDDDVIMCPCHMGSFDMATGEVTDGPPPAPIQAYEVRIEDGDIQVGL